MNFEQLGLRAEVLRGVEDAGYTEPTPIQAQAIPAVLAGRDVIGASQTGTGKTAAFSLPMLQRLSEQPRNQLRCLILEPTRELAAQVQDYIANIGSHTGLRSALIHGGVGYGTQIEALQQGFEIIIATPGRLLDHMQRGAAKLDKLDVLILDEVDRMLDMGFLPDVRRILKHCPRERQTLFFSATMPPEIKSLADWVLKKDPLEIEIGQRLSAADTVTHAFYPVAGDQREELLFELLRRTDFQSVMIFTRTKVQADRLFARVVKETDHAVTVMHSDIRQSDRAAALQGFREGKFAVIIATDLAARGLDISGVSHVINYQVPENAEDYVHRIGRTGRARREGDAFTLLAADELPYAESIEKLIGQKILRHKLDEFPYRYTTLLDDETTVPFSAAFGRRKGRSRSTRRRR